MCEKEEKKIAANPKYRTPRRTLKRLAEAHMFYEFDCRSELNRWSRPSRPAFKVGISDWALAPEGHFGFWDTFSIRNLGLLINRRMAREFNGDSQKIRRASKAAVARALRINTDRWPLNEQQSLENWSLVLALIPDLAHWSPEEKQTVIKIIRAKSARNEMSYLRQTQKHARLRAELIRLGSK